MFAANREGAARAVLAVLVLAAVMCFGLFACDAFGQTAPTAVVVSANPQPVCLNPTYRALALEQGIPVGSTAWLAGGDGLLPSDTGGGHASYGWRHDHLLSTAWARAVVANFAARPVFYESAPVRLSGYVTGGRPVGWATEPGSQNDPAQWKSYGAALYGTLAVGGYDLEHIAASPLVSVARSSGLTVRQPGAGAVPAEIVARDLLRRLLAAHAGMLRNADGTLTKSVLHDRPARYICGNLAAGIALDCIDPTDRATMEDYVRLRLLPHWMGPPDNDPGKGGDLQVYNGVLWAVPALADLALVTPPGKLRDQMVLALRRQCMKVALLQALVPGHACAVDRIDSWTNLTAAGIHFPKASDLVTDLYYTGPWGVRAMDLAGLLLGLPACREEAKNEAAKWKKDAANQVWLVDATGAPLFGAAK